MSQLFINHGVVDQVATETFRHAGTKREEIDDYSTGFARLADVKWTSADSDQAFGEIQRLCTNVHDNADTQDRFGRGQTLANEVCMEAGRRSQAAIARLG